MRGATALVRAQNKVVPAKGPWGILTSKIPKKHEGNESAAEGKLKEEKAEPIVAFSRPPPNLPFLGPLVAVSLFNTWSSKDSDDD